MIKKLIITIIALTVGALHFLEGRSYQGPFPIFVNGYLIDILLPMTLYLLISLFQNKLIRSPSFVPVRYLASDVSWRHPNILAILFRSIFDPLDILAYASGVLLGILLDLVLLPGLGTGCR